MKEPPSPNRVLYVQVADILPGKMDAWISRESCSACFPQAAVGCFQSQARATAREGLRPYQGDLLREVLEDYTSNGDTSRGARGRRESGAFLGRKRNHGKGEDSAEGVWTES